MQIGKNGAQTPVAAVVLAGGRSTRMGRDKAYLPWGETSLLQHVVSLVRAHFETVYVSARSREAYPDVGVPVIADTGPGSGPLRGVTTALAAVEHEWLFATACDMPFADPAVWEALAAHAGPEVDAVVPRIPDGLEPLCAFYHRRCLPAFQARLAAGHPALFQALHTVRMRDVNATSWLRARRNPFANINTPEEFTTACATDDRPMSVAGGRS